MKVFAKYKSVWVFLLKFFSVYLVGVFIYNQYLSLYVFRIDVFTAALTEQVARLLSLTLPEISTYYSCEAPVSEIRYFNVPVSLLIEGCNAISVMILFVSFLIAFTGKWKNYLWFIPLGLLVLYVSNVIRIYLLALIVLYYPSYSEPAHDYLFPGIIYGTVFILWVIWVRLVVIYRNTVNQ